MAAKAGLKHYIGSETELILSHVKCTSSSVDGLPAQLFQQYSYDLADIVTVLLAWGLLTIQRLTAVISLAPKIVSLKVLTYLRYLNYVQNSGEAVAGCGSIGECGRLLSLPSWLSGTLYTMSQKNCANLFLSELRQIYIYFDNIWQKDGKEARII